MQQYGHTIYDLDFANPTPADDPAPVLKTLKLFVSGQGTDPHAAPAGGRRKAHAGIRQRRFGSQTGAGDERHEGGDHDPRGVAIVEASGLAEFAHQIGEDTVVIAEELHQQADQQAAGSADQDREEAYIQTQRLCGIFLKPLRAHLNESNKGEGDQGADHAEHDDEHHEFYVGCWLGLWVDRSTPPDKARGWHNLVQSGFVRYPAAIFSSI